MKINVMHSHLLKMVNANRLINYAILKLLIVLFVLKKINVQHVNKVIRFKMENVN